MTNGERTRNWWRALDNLTDCGGNLTNLTEEQVLQSLSDMLDAVAAEAREAGGCARDQHTTQYCAEAVQAMRERDEYSRAMMAEESAKKEALDVVQSMCEQSCTRGDTLDSGAITAYADGLLLLESHGRLEVEAEVGRRVIGRLK